MSAKRRDLACAVCGKYAGKWQQFWNQDAGWGLCGRCAGSLPLSDAEIQDTYGKEGVNWGRQLETFK